MTIDQWSTGSSRYASDLEGTIHATTTSSGPPQIIDDGAGDIAGELTWPKIPLPTLAVPIMTVMAIHRGLEEEEGVFAP